jgi:hypothetical protein
MRTSAINVAFLGFVAFLFQTVPASAYLDPGTGSMMLQLLLGGIAGAMVVGKLYWQRFRQFVTSLFSAKPREHTRTKQAGASSGADAPG